MDFSKTKPSKNFTDNTGDSPAVRYLDGLLNRLNPVTAYRNLRTELIKGGVLEISGTESMIAKAQERQQNLQALRDQYISAGLTPEEADQLIVSGL